MKYHGVIKSLKTYLKKTKIEKKRGKNKKQKDVNVHFEDFPVQRKVRFVRQWTILCYYTLISSEPAVSATQQWQYRFSSSRNCSKMYLKPFQTKTRH